MKGIVKDITPVSRNTTPKIQKSTNTLHLKKFPRSYFHGVTSAKLNSVTLAVSHRDHYAVATALVTPYKLRHHRPSFNSGQTALQFPRQNPPFSHKFAGNPMQIFCYKRTTFFLLFRILHRVTYFLRIRHRVTFSFF